MSKIVKDACGGLRNCNLESWIQDRQEANDPVIMRVILAIQYVYFQYMYTFNICILD